MSLEHDVYLIVGYDLTGLITEKFKEWIWSEEASKYKDYANVGNVQLFQNKDGIYLGCILATGNDEKCELQRISLGTVGSLKLKEKVDKIIKYLRDNDLIEVKSALFYEMLFFEQVT